MTVQRRYKNGIWYLKMYCSIAAKKKQNKIGGNSTTEWRGNRRDSIEGYKYLGISKLYKIMCDEMNKDVSEVYQKRITLLLKTRLNEENLFLALNIWAISLI